MPKLFAYDMVGLTPGNPRSTQTYGGVVEAETPKAALLAAIDDNFGDKDDGATPYERLSRAWVDSDAIDSDWGSLTDDTKNFVLDTGDLEFHVSVEEITHRG